LGKFGPYAKRVRPLLRAMQDDPDPGVRKSVVTARTELEKSSRTAVKTPP
jgi:hypothetical protein